MDVELRRHFFLRNFTLHINELGRHFFFFIGSVHFSLPQFALLLLFRFTSRTVTIRQMTLPLPKKMKRVFLYVFLFIYSFEYSVECGN
jgi:hypothetical protein